MYLSTRNDNRSPLSLGMVRVYFRLKEERHSRGRNVKGMTACSSSASSASSLNLIDRLAFSEGSI